MESAFQQYTFDVNTDSSFQKPGSRHIRDLSKFTTQGYSRGRNIFWQLAWYLTSNLFFKSFITPKFIRPHVLRLFGAKVGRGSVIRSNVKIHWPWKLKMGNHVWLGEGVWLLNLEEIEIGDSVCISQEAFICTGSHDVKSLDFRFRNRPIKIERGVWICARATVLAGSIVPEYSVVPSAQIVKNLN